MGVMNTNQRPATAAVYTPKSSQPNEQLQEARRLYNQGKGEHQAGNFSLAVQLFVRAVQMFENLLGKFHSDTVKTYWRLGRSAAFAGQDQKSIEAFHRAMRMADTTFDDLVVQSVLSDVDACWQRKSTTADVPPPQQPHDEPHDGGVEVTANNDSSQPSPSNDLAQILVFEKQADLSCKKRDFRKAVESYQDALNLLTKLVGQDLTLDGADLYVKKATCDLRISNTEGALSGLKAAHDCYLQQLGADHPATLGAAANLKAVQRAGRNDNMVHKTRKHNGGWFSASLSSLVGSVSEHSPTPNGTKPAGVVGGDA